MGKSPETKEIISLIAENLPLLWGSTNEFPHLKSIPETRYVEKYERPDFILEIEGRKIGVETTKIYSRK